MSGGTSLELLCAGEVFLFGIESVTTTDTTGVRPIYWTDETVKLLDQTLLPSQEVWLDLTDYRDVVRAIKDMLIRGAPAIGIAGAYALALAALEFRSAPPLEMMAQMESAAVEIEAARPTGANLAWAVRRMMVVARLANSPDDLVDALVREALSIQQEDVQANHEIGRLGAELLESGSSVLTHCNAGALATGGYGTALGVIQSAWSDGKIDRVFATETRPYLQGARLTAWELVQAKIDTTLVADSAAGQLINSGVLNAVIVGADRIAANGDVANKIGTYSLAVLANESGVPFYVAAPTGTIDLTLADGDAIPVEERSQEEVVNMAGVRVAAEGVRVMNPAFDVTPNRFVTAIVTEKAVVRQPYGQGLRSAVVAAYG